MTTPKILNIVLAIAVVILIVKLTKAKSHDSGASSSNSSSQIAEEGIFATKTLNGVDLIVPSKEKVETDKIVMPAPVTIVGSKIGDKANFMAAAFVGIVSSEPRMVAVGVKGSRYTIEGMLKNKSFSINIPSRNLLKETDIVGTVSGRDMDKTTLFDVYYGKNTMAPLIKEAAVNIECEIVGDFSAGKGYSHHIFIAKMTKTHVSKNLFTGGKPDMAKINPILDSFTTSQYYSLGTPLEKVGFSKRNKKK